MLEIMMSADFCAFMKNVTKFTRLLENLPKNLLELLENDAL